MISWNTENKITGKYKKWLFDFWCNFLYKRLQSAYIITCPDTWDKDYLYDNLFMKVGYLTVFDSELFGVIPQICTLSYPNIYDKEIGCRVLKHVTTPDGVLHEIDFTGTIGENCVLLAPFGDRSNFFYKVVTQYAHRLSLLIPSVDMSILNSRLAYVFAAKDKASAETIKDIMDKVYNGYPAVTYDKLLGKPDDRSDTENWNFVQLNASSAYLVDKLLADIDTTIRQFDSVIGLPTQPNKKERLITDEVGNQECNTFCIAKQVKENLTEQFDSVKSMFPDITDLSIEIRGEKEMEEQKQEALQLAKSQSMNNKGVSK